MHLTRLEILLTAAADRLRHPLLLLVRLYWGLAFAQAGWGKLMHPARTAAFFGDLGLPLPLLNAVAAGGVECLGGLLLALGLAARPAAAALAFTMTVAYVTADREAVLTLFTAPGNFTAAPPFLFLAASVIVLAFGPGAWALDARRRIDYPRQAATNVPTPPLRPA